MYIFIAANETLNEGQKTSLYSIALDGQKTLISRNSANFAADMFVRIGRKGDEITESGQIDSITGDVITLKYNLKNTHDPDTEIVEIYFNQRKIYREQTVGLGDYTPVSGITNPKDISFDNPDGTIFNDPNGSSALRYKCTYFNTQTSTESSIDDSVSVYGGQRGYADIDDIRSEAGFNNNPYVTDYDILLELKNATDEINGKLANIYVLPLSYTPAIISDIATHLTLGRLFHREYPGIDPMYAKEGEGRMREGRNGLNDIMKRKIILLDESLIEMPRVPTDKPSGWPNASTSSVDEADSGGDHVFRMSHKF